MNRRPVFLITVLAFGFAFFYVPILSMIVYSFNASRLATVWGGFSTKWYRRAVHNDQVIRAAILSLKIALLSATLRDRSSAPWPASRWPGSSGSAAGCCSRAWSPRR